MQPRIPSIAVLTSLVLFAASDFAAAQINAPDCSSSWDWTSNTLGQSVCMVTAYMLATCNSSVFTVNPLTSEEAYGYMLDESDFERCECNVIAYNLLSACEACQRAKGSTWEWYSGNCPVGIDPLPFPNPVPSGTSLPQWALVDSTRTNNWNIAEAYRIYQDGVPDLEPGSSVRAKDPGGVSPTSSTSLSEASTTSGTSPSGVSPTSSTSPSGVSPTSSTSSSGGSFPPSSSGSGPNTAAIAGGVVGGVVALAAIGALLFHILRKRQRSQAQSTEVGGGMSPMSQEHSPVSKTRVAPMNFYDPNDPRTFPEYQGVSTSAQDVHVPVSPNDGNLNGNTLAKMQATFTLGYRGLPTV
ncbi:hypothetical protein EDB87DRAFT_566831 [Lactarius vividus]|nr:hypothetical protein EDB87DRAFT_566831 [Lactarius vividus]